MRHDDPLVVRGLAGHAIGAGATVHRVGYVEWDIAERCEAPVFRGMFGRAERDHPDGRIRAPVRLDLWARCRRCVACLRMRRRLWTARACQEMRESSRTWLLTFTLRPEEQYRMLLRSGVRGAGPTEEFDGRQRECSKEITKYLKRVRESAGSFRYLVVCEAHKSGLPHYHGFIHERDKAVPWECLSGHWHLGWIEAVLVKDGPLYKEVYYEDGKRRWRWSAEPGVQGKVARYAAKYLAKSVLARVRASQRYGDGPVGQPDQIGL